MTFKNKHSFISGFLGAALLIASSCALGGCTEIADEPQGIDDAGNGHAPHHPRHCKRLRFLRAGRHPRHTHTH